MKRIIFGTYRDGVYISENFDRCMDDLRSERALDIPLPNHLFRVCHVGAPYHATVVFDEFQGDALESHPVTRVILMGEFGSVKLLEEKILKYHASTSNDPRLIKSKIDTGVIV